MALTDEFIFINIMENIKKRFDDNIGSEIMGKPITYVFGNQVREDVEVPAIAIEDSIADNKTTFEIGGRQKLTVTYNVWVHAGGTGSYNKDEGMKQRIKGMLYEAFSKKYSLPFYDFINGGVEEGTFMTDISLRASIPSIYSKLDAHKLIGVLTITKIY